MKRLLVTVGLAACAAPPPATGITIDDAMMARAMAGTWAWDLTTTVDGVRRDEHERWQLEPTDDWLTLRGRYARTVELTATDGVPFPCVQSPRYRLASTVEVLVTAAPGGADVREVGYQAAPSPCDRGLRRLADYHGALVDDRLVLTWPDGSATLTRNDPTPPPPLPALAAAPAGPWTWTSTSWQVDGRVQRETEAWELAVGDDGALAGWYLRTVEVRDPRGDVIACAGAPGYRYTDRYLVRGQRQPADDDDARGDWRFDEIAVAADPHPCLAASPTRSTDGATVDVIGDMLVLTWRGARRQVLQRPAYSSEYAGL